MKKYQSISSLDPETRYDDGEGKTTVISDKQHRQPFLDNNNNNNSTTIRAQQFFLFLCLSTALRSFEAGIISSMMPNISSSLGIDYTQQGSIAASPDYGIAPGALTSIFVYRWTNNPRRVLLLVMIGTSTTAIVCSVWPSYPMLVVARALGGFFWSMAAVHYPVWIDQHDSNQGTIPPSQRTLWLAIVNVSLLGGILTGYLVGGFFLVGGFSTSLNTSTNDSSYYKVTWIDLYFVEGLFMLACALLLKTCFDDDLVQIGNSRRTTTNRNQRNFFQRNEEGEAEEEELEERSMKYIMLSLIKSVPFCLSVAITACISGGVVFALYFITQVCVARGLAQDATVIVVAVVFILAPGPGMLFGSWAVAKLGGYIDHKVTFGVALISSIFVQVATVVFVISSMDDDNEDTLLWPSWINMNKYNKDLLFMLACWIFFFAGGMSGPPLNGIAVSTVKEASHVASGLQFALANAAKILVPQLGGYICNQIGLIEGFNYTLILFCLIFICLAASGLIHSINQRQQSNTVRVSSTETSYGSIMSSQ